MREKIQFMLLIILGILFILIFGGLIWSVLRHSIGVLGALLVNTVSGLVAIFLLNFLGLGIPVNTITIIVAAVFGLLGVGVLAFLAIFGIL
jgi:hypothetical protein